MDKFGSIASIKDLIESEQESNSVIYGDRNLHVLPIILPNEGLIILQLFGWSINLKKDGTYIVEATDGG